VLDNDLREAAMRADPFAGRWLPEIVRFLNSYVPAPAWGSPAAVDAWLADPETVPEIFE
jgi:hypothetical protein